MGSNVGLKLRIGMCFRGSPGTECPSRMQFVILHP